MHAFDDREIPAGAVVKAVWIVDDDRSIRWVLEKALAREGIPFKTFASVIEVMQALQHSQPQVLVSDIRMPGESGLTLLNKIKERHPRIPVIIMTAYSDLDSAVAAFQGGAFEYLAKPFDVDHAIALIRRAGTEVAVAATAAPSSADTPEMLGQAPAMQEVFRAIGRLSQSHVTVLITGESGTGKELVAHALHRHSVRAAQPFVAINTAAIPKDLLESELFGHERGAFTGAQSSRRGRFRSAPAQRTCRATIRGHQYRGDTEGPSGIGVVRPRARCVHRRAELAPRTIPICTGTAYVPRNHSWPSIPRRYRRTFWNRSCSATSAVRSPARRARAADDSDLHRHSVRAAQPFVAINTAAIPKDLLESELFGHERGAFTGAQSSRRGRFEQADGGTLF